MNALRALHETLRPGGWLLDVHPEPLPRYIEIRERDQVLPIGHVEIPDQISQITVAREALQVAVDASQFAHERALIFDFLYHFDSVDAWLEFMATHGQEEYVGAEIIARGRDLLRAGSAELCMRRRIRAARLRRV